MKKQNIYLYTKSKSVYKIVNVIRTTQPRIYGMSLQIGKAINILVSEMRE